MAERVPLVQAQTRQTVRLSMALAGLAATAALTGEARWVPLHLFLAGAVVLAISGASQLLTVTWSAAPAPPDRWAAIQRWTVAVGATGVVAARRLDAPDATLGLAGAVYLFGLALLGVLLAATAARGLELPGSRGHLILGETLEEGGPDGSSSEVPARVPS